MDILEIVNFGSLKRYWRRRRYQRLDDATKIKRKLKIAKLFAKFYRFYIDAMIRLVSYKKSNNGLINEKKVSKPNNRAFLMVSSGTNEVIDCRLVLEIYKRILSSRQSAGLLT